MNPTRMPLPGRILASAAAEEWFATAATTASTTTSSGDDGAIPEYVSGKTCIGRPRAALIVGRGIAAAPAPLPVGGLPAPHR